MAEVPFVVGVAGGSGSGKTTMVRGLRDLLPPGEVCLISQDDYYHPIEQQPLDANGQVNFDLPQCLDLDRLTRDIRSLLAGGSLRRREYTFNMACSEDRWLEIQPAPVILIEGLFVLHHGPLRELLDLKVFVDTDLDRQLERRLARDMAERGYSAEAIHYQWQYHVLPAYRMYLEPYREHCDLHLDNGSDARAAVSSLYSRVLASVPHMAAVCEPQVV